jgi:cytochrome c oxidase accessory protein FixG
MLSLQTYHAKRRLVQVVSTLIIVALPFLNILRLDIPTLRFYFFSSVLWVDEFYLLFLVIMLVLWVIIIFSMMYGRVWCGWMCPQTVLSELSHWFETKTLRWFRVPKKGGSPVRRLAAFGLNAIGSLAVSLLIAFNLVIYFVDPYRTLGEIATLSLSPVTAGILIGAAVLMLVDVMFWREKFCTKACPYGMLQTVVTDAKTQIVRYQTERTDECIECKACVRDCMMGIDIRVSPHQTECIHCGDCVDSCATILQRLGKPTLITFSWGENAKKDTWYEKLGFLDAKRWAVAGLTVVYALVLVIVIGLRQPLSLSASGDRSTLFRKGDDGLIYNDYALRISNRSLTDGSFVVTPDFRGCVVHLAQNPIPLKSREVRDLRVSISCDGAGLKPGPNRLQLSAVNASDAQIHTSTEIVFFMPQ